MQLENRSLLPFKMERNVFPPEKGWRLKLLSCWQDNNSSLKKLLPWSLTSWHRDQISQREQFLWGNKRCVSTSSTKSDYQNHLSWSQWRRDKDQKYWRLETYIVKTLQIKINHLASGGEELWTGYPQYREGRQLACRAWGYCWSCWWAPWELAHMHTHNYLKQNNLFSHLGKTLCIFDFFHMGKKPIGY